MGMRMKKCLLSIVCLFISILGQAQVITLDQGGKYPQGSWYCFRNTVTLDDEPENVKLWLAADSKYWLWVNGVLQVREGALKRGPNPQDTYCDVITSLSDLKKGKNTIAVLVWYFGKDGFSHRNSPTAGMTFRLQVNGKEVDVDKEWRALQHPAFYKPKAKKPNYRLAESNVGFDAAKNIDFISPEFDDTEWPKAKVVSLEKAGWNNLVERPIPFWKDFGLKSYQRTEQNDTAILAYMPYNAQIMPYIRLRAEAGECIRIYTDNYHGGSSTNVLAEYLTTSGEQEFECWGG